MEANTIVFHITLVRNVTKHISKYVGLFLESIEYKKKISDTSQNDLVEEKTIKYS